MNWQIGDRALCITPGSQMEGRIVVIISGIYDFYSVNEQKTVRGYEVDPGIPPPNGYGWACKPCHLQKLPDEYDGHKTTTWDECPWQPERVSQ